MKRSYIYKVYWNILRMYVLRVIFHRGRTDRSQTHVLQEYKEAWSETAEDILFGRKLRVQRTDGRLIIGRAIDSRKFFFGHINGILRSFQPETVLELGSGIGINILALAVLNPDIKSLKGIELTEQGVRQAQTLLKNPPMKALIYLTELPEKTIRERLAHRDIEFVQGSILKLPWPEESFDFVFSAWVMEQIPRDYLHAFSEARRALRSEGHALFIEEFIEAQENIFQRLHLQNVDYFRASYSEVEKAGLTVLRFEPLPMSKIKLTYGSLLCSAE